MKKNKEATMKNNKEELVRLNKLKCQVMNNYILLCHEKKNIIKDSIKNGKVVDVICVRNMSLDIEIYREQINQIESMIQSRRFCNIYR